MSPRRAGRMGRAGLTASLAGFFALVGLGVVMAITGFGPGLGQCAPGAGSVHGLTPMVGGGEMATHGCASQAAAAAVWPWPVVGATVGAVFGVIVALGVLTVLRAIGRLGRRPARFAHTS